MNEAPCGYDHAPKGGELLAQFGPSLKVDLGFDSKFVAGFGDLPKLDEHGLDALIDTGASENYLDRDMAEKLGLPPIDRDDVATPLGTQTVTLYLAQIHVIALDKVIFSKFASVNLRANQIAFDVVLGRTFLQNYQFFYDGPTGRATIRKPDIATR